MNKKSFYLGLHDSIPICIAFSFMFFSLGTLAHLHSFSFLQGIVLTAGVFAAPLQVILLNNMSHVLGLIGITTLLVNFRFILMTASISKHLKEVPHWKLLLAFSTISASSFTVSYTRIKNGLDNINFFSYFLAVSVVTYFLAIVATLLGYVVMAKLNSPYLNTLFAIVLPIHFSGLAAKYMPNLRLVLATIFGIVLTPFSLMLFPKLTILILPFMIGLILVIYDLLTGQPK